MSYTNLASDDSITKTVSALKSKNIEPFVVDNGKAALEMIKTLIPPGVSVMNGSSATLEQIGFVDYLKLGRHGWNNLHEAIVNEKDPVMQVTLRKQAITSDYYLGSVHALAESGDFVIGSNTGSQLPHIVFSSPNLVFIVSTKKIVPTLTDALKRLEEYVVPLEDKHMQEKYGIGTSLNKIVIFKNENARLGRTIRMILVKEDLGY